MLSWLLAINLTTFMVFSLDKRLANLASTRIPERFLLGLALVGGSPGAWLAMQIFRHKTRKGAFLRRFWLIVAGQAALVFFFLALVRPLFGGE